MDGGGRWDPGPQCGTDLNSQVLSKAGRFLPQRVCSERDGSPTRRPGDRGPPGAAALSAPVGPAGRLPPSPVRPTAPGRRWGALGGLKSQDKVRA